MNMIDPDRLRPGNGRTAIESVLEQVREPLHDLVLNVCAAIESRR